MKYLVLLIVLVLPLTDRARAAELNPILLDWLKTQTNVQTWAADFVQTRTLKALTQPLTATGHVSFAAPRDFRWELGQPAQTIAVRHEDEMLILYPKLRRAERYNFSGAKGGQWKETLSLLETGFPRSQAEIESRFNILGIIETNGVHEVRLQPKSSVARKVMPSITIIISTQASQLVGTQLEFADGSVMRNDFTQIVLNPKLDGSLFKPAIPSDFKIIEPMKSGGF